jgi:type VI secretion system protein ImpJ
VALPLALVSPTIYATPINDDKYLENTRLYLAISAEMGVGDLIQKAPRLIKICSTSHMERLITNALPGLELRHIPPPNAVPIKLNYTYFALSQSGPGWEAIIRTRNFAAHVPKEIPNPQMELIILLPAAGKKN